MTSREWHARGPAAVLDEHLTGERFVLTVDLDGLDPAVFPAVAMPTPGGLTYEDLLGLMQGLAQRGTLASVILAEYVPERDDAQRLCALTAARIAATAVALMAR